MKITAQCEICNRRAKKYLLVRDIKRCGKHKDLAKYLKTN
jgi:hypothetical protein